METTGLLNDVLGAQISRVAGQYIRERNGGYRGEGDLSGLMFENRMAKAKTKQQGISMMFRQILEDYLPGGYFRWNEYADKMANSYYRMAYKYFREVMPKLITEKLNKEVLEDKSGETDVKIDIDPEMLDQIVMDSMVYMHEHPEEIKLGLLRSYHPGDDIKKGGEAGFFVPRIDERVYEEKRKALGSEFDSDKIKVGGRDEEVLDNLRGRDEVKWKWLGIDENKVLHFTLPDLYGDREFRIKLPGGIKYIRPGEYHFRVKNVSTKGAELEFVEQMSGKYGRELEEIEESGLNEEELRRFINNGILNRYITILRGEPLGKVLENYLGMFRIGNKEFSTVEDLQELIGLGEELEEVKGRGKEEIEEKYEKSRELSKGKIKEMVDRWLRAPSVAEHFLKVREDEGENIAKAVASKFPMKPVKGKLSIQSILETMPVVEMVLETIMSPHTPLTGGGKGLPWIHLVWKKFQEMALREPQVRFNIEELIRQKTGINGRIPDSEIINELSGVKDSNKLFLRLREEIQRVMEGMRGDPSLSKFFERKKVFDEYIRSRLEYEVEEFIKENKLSMLDPKAVKKVERFMDTFTSKVVNQMSRRDAPRSASLDEGLIHSLISGAMLRLSFLREKKQGV